ncbi:MAG TPA: hypothetical protein VLX68_01240 [Chitinivibrionales bacterium]|nr:hypothetical protein [Chitinivibrionales bacterium]
MKKSLLFCLVWSASVLCSAADYFPIETGNSWTFSFQSVYEPAVLNAPVTRDSGTVIWEMAGVYATMSTVAVAVKQTRSLARRSLTSITTPGYDSVFAPPRITIDTVLLIQKGNDISFLNDTSPIAVHDPNLPLPAGLSLIDTTITFQSKDLAAKKTVPSMEMNTVSPSPISTSFSEKLPTYISFILGDSIGPIEAYIAISKGWFGFGYQETWKLVSREYPAAVLKGNAQTLFSGSGITVSRNSSCITSSFCLPCPLPVYVVLTDLQGRMVQKVFAGTLDKGMHSFALNAPLRQSGILVLCVQTGDVTISRRIIMTK